MKGSNWESSNVSDVEWEKSWQFHSAKNQRRKAGDDCILVWVIETRDGTFLPGRSFLHTVLDVNPIKPTLFQTPPRCLRNPIQLRKWYVVTSLPTYRLFFYRVHTRYTYTYSPSVSLSRETTTPTPLRCIQLRHLWIATAI